MDLTLYAQTYRASTPGRQQEHNECLRRNLNHPAIRKVVLFKESDAPPLPQASVELEVVKRQGSGGALLLNADIDLDEGLMPTNLYGPGDIHHPNHSHVLPALNRCFHEAAQQPNQGADTTLTCWGTGSSQLEFLHVDDPGEGCVFALEHWQPGPEELQFLNVGTGVDLSIRELAEQVAAATGHGERLRLMAAVDVLLLPWRVDLVLRQELPDELEAHVRRVGLCSWTASSVPGGSEP